MAAAKKAPAKAADDEEIFEDLRQDDGAPADEGKGLSVLLDDDDDEDLQVVDDPVEEEEEAEEEAEEEEAEEEAQPAAARAAAGADDFDPKDVQILVGRAENLEFREKSANDAKARAEADLVTAEAAMIAAKEAGDSKADVAATKAYAQATTALETAKNEITGLVDAKKQLVGQVQALIAKAPKDEKGNAILDRRPPPPAAQERATKPTESVTKWVKENKWFSDPKFAAQSTTLRGMDEGLAAEGKLKKGSPEYMAELGSRFNKVYPGIYKIDGKPVATGQRTRGNGARGGPIPGGNSDAGRRAPAQQGNAVKLTNDDLGLMSKFGMDPTNMAHRRTWLNEKRAQAAQAAKES